MNHTTERFQRTAKNSPQRSPDPFAGPYRRPRFYAVHAVGYLLTLAIAIACTLVLIVNLR